MKNIFFMVFLFLSFSSSALAEPCVESGTTGSALARAALNLEPGHWCKLNAQVEAGASIRELIRTCMTGNTDISSSYSSTMGYDQANGKIWYYGTSHGGGAMFTFYSLATHTWTALNSQEVTYPTCRQMTCDAGAPWGANQTACAGCNAAHSYNSNAVDHHGHLWYGSLNTSTFYRWDGSTWSNPTGCPSPAWGATAAMAFWPTLQRLAVLCGGGNELFYTYDPDQNAWSPIGEMTTVNGYHNQVLYHPEVDEMWIQDGNGSPKQARAFLVDGSPRIEQLPDATAGRLGLTNNRCVADPSSHDTFICWIMKEDTPGTTSAGWYAFDLSTTQWTPLADLGVNSMPPLDALREDIISGTSLLSAPISNYGVMAFLTDGNDESSNAGMYVYKHTQFTGDSTPPSPPMNLEVQ